jgi:hypothetical protein
LDITFKATMGWGMNGWWRRGGVEGDEVFEVKGV